MRLTHEVLVHLSDDTAQEQTLFQRKTILSRITVDCYEKHAGGSFKVVSTETDALSLGDIEAGKGLYLEADGDCSVYINGSADPIVLRKATAITGGATPAKVKLFLESDITSVSIEASEGADVVGTFVIWGDVVP